MGALWQCKSEHAGHCKDTGDSKVVENNVPADVLTYCCRGGYLLQEVLVA